MCAPPPVTGWTSLLALKNTNQLAGEGMGDEQLRHLAQFCAWDFVPAGQNIATQGAVGYSFVLLLKGAARVNSLDVDGKLRPQSLLRAGDAFGRMSLLESKRRDATVRAVSEGEGPSRMPGAEILTLDRRDLRNVFADHPDLWKAGVWLVDGSRQSAEPTSYAWQQEGETVTWQGRKHLLWFLGPELMILLVFLLLVSGGFEPCRDQRNGSHLRIDPVWLILRPHCLVVGRKLPPKFLRDH